jgi:type IX secretion system PorP/SprF family membrane protein
MIQKLAVIIALFITLGSYAQDPQLSQYYNAPLYLNPGLTGAGLDTRAGINYRLQWPGLGDPYKAFAVWADHDFYKARSGVGFMIKRDIQGATKLRSTEINALYSYQINVTDDWTIKPGLQLGMGIRDVDFSKSIFGDQLGNDGNTGNSTNDPLAAQGKSYVYPDISAGAVGYNSNLWLGVSAHHINRPNQSFSTIQRTPLPVKWSFIGGYKILLQERVIAWGAPVKETSITPTFLYKMQGPADQLDVGVYLIHNPFMAGMWYRGLPVKKYGTGVKNTESLVLMAGLLHNGLTISYSYDIVVSQLASLSGGAHEISLIYQWQTDKSNRKGKKGYRPMPCPNVDRRFKNFKQ